ncbi:MAG: ABC transporter ATP-binding protein [Deltaproteobacteria bacterium]|nr:ABC transporter ATP-binding protein [Deltaproteobacteria bacterium]
MTGCSVKLEGVRHVFPNGVIALAAMDLEVAAGEFLAILGPSGCGKSTLLRIVAGLERPSAGRVVVGENRTKHGVAYVFQDAHLLPWRTVLNNAALPLELQGVERARRNEVAAEVLAKVGLGDALDRYPAQLSGGMRMRVSLARAMVTEPALLLLDEPFAALDEITRQRLDEQLRELWRARGMTVIFVTHSTGEAVFLAERAVVMSPRPGRIVADHRISLPAARTGELRATAEFAQQTRSIYEALDRGAA